MLDYCKVRCAVAVIVAVALVVGLRGGETEDIVGPQT
jgi:hypothetical protein